MAIEKNEILNDEKTKDVLKKFFALLLTWQQSEKRGEVKNDWIR